MCRTAALLVALSGILASGRAARGDVAAEIAAMSAALPPCDTARAHCLAIRLHITAGGEGRGDGPGDRPGDRLIAAPDWLAAQLATANRQFAALDVGFQVAGVDALPASCARIATRRDRDALASRLGGTVIDVFITGQLDDVDRPDGIIRGVTWHVRGGERKYVIVSTAAPGRVLAHELGHVFGLPHSSYAISIMNKTERAEPPPEERRFADEELAAMRPVLERLLRAQVIADVAPRSIGGFP